MNKLKSILSHQFFDYGLTYMIIALSGIMYFYKNNDEYTILGCMVSSLIFIVRKKKIDNFFYVIILLFAAIEYLQMTWYGIYSFKSLIGNLLKLTFVYLSVKIVYDRYIELYIKIMVFSAIVSYFFYLLTYVPGTTNFIVKNICPIFKPLFPLPSTLRYSFSPNIIVYNYNYEHVFLFRNVGPFWESGAFGTYLNFALMFNMIREKNLFSRTNIIIIVAIISTFSTACYLAMFFFVFSYYLTRKDVKYKVLYIMLAGTVSVYSFFSLSFMQEKIEENIANSDETTKSRFGSAVADIKVFSMNPMLGIGRSFENRERISRKLNVLPHRNNGVTGLLADYGILIFIFYFASIYYSFKRYVRDHYQFSNIGMVTWVMFANIIIMGFAQRFFLFPFAYSLLFLHLINFKKKENEVGLNMS